MTRRRAVLSAYERDCRAVVTFYCDDPSRARRCLDRHRPDGRDMCRGCSQTQRSPWPCVHVHLASTALELVPAPRRPK